MTWKTIETRFAGKCHLCKRIIEPGEKVRWESHSKATECPDCIKEHFEAKKVPELLHEPVKEAVDDLPF